jgi:hypothetical protein
MLMQWPPDQLQGGWFPLSNSGKTNREHVAQRDELQVVTATFSGAFFHQYHHLAGFYYLSLPVSLALWIWRYVVS